MIALDTNILVYARREELPHHKKALRLLRDLAEGEMQWALPWPCVYEFLRVVTHPRVINPPTPLEAALQDLESLLESQSLVMLGEGPAHRGHMIRCILSGRAAGNLAHDAHIATLVLEHGISELLSTDRDFSRFPDIKTRNPFV
jgi:uncharacterized protein